MELFIIRGTVIAFWKVLVPKVILVNKVLCICMQQPLAIFHSHMQLAHDVHQNHVKSWAQSNRNHRHRCNHKHVPYQDPYRCQHHGHHVILPTVMKSIIRKPCKIQRLDNINTLFLCVMRTKFKWIFYNNCNAIFAFTEKIDFEPWCTWKSFAGPTKRWCIIGAQFLVDENIQFAKNQIKSFSFLKTA